MIEAIGMITVLAGMGIYFVKSTDLPKDLRDRSERHNSTSSQVNNLTTKKRYAFPQQNGNASISENKITKSDYMNELELKLKRQKMIEAKNKKIDELTILITALEQELKENNARNQEIQKQIDVAMAELIQLKNSIIA